MRFVVNSLCLCVVALLPISASPADKPLSPSGETAAEKLRKALDQVRDLEIADQPLDTAVNQLREQTGINFVLDRAGVPGTPSTNVFANTNVLPALQFLPLSYFHLRIGGQFHQTPLRIALSKMLRTHNLTHVLVGDTVYITTAQKATDRQLGQSVSVNIEKVTLSDVLKRLSRDTGANVVLDPRSAKEGGTALTLRLDEVPLETAVELLADEAGLRAVRMSNVLYVTSEARAEKLRKSRPAAAATPTGAWRVWPDGKGGFRLTPPPGTGIGGGGLGGLGGIGGMAGLGGGFNQIGANGGFAGIGGGVAKPVPLTPGLPKAKQPAPAKPKEDKPALPDKPTIKPVGKDRPTSKDKPTPQAIRSSKRTPHSRRKRCRRLRLSVNPQEIGKIGALVRRLGGQPSRFRHPLREFPSCTASSCPSVSSPCSLSSPEAGPPIPNRKRHRKQSNPRSRRPKPESPYPLNWCAASISPSTTIRRRP